MGEKNIRIWYRYKKNNKILGYGMGAKKNQDMVWVKKKLGYGIGNLK